MKLPRWLVIAMLTTSGLAVLATAGWCWVTWPDQTALEFVELIAAGKREEANRMVHYPLNDFVLFEGYQPPPLKTPLTSVPRTLMDILFARQVIVGKDRWFYCVEQGSISSAGPSWDFLLTSWIIEAS